jgi:hypothetical protein
MSHKIEHEVATGCEVIEPGWVRVNFNYFIPEEEFEFIVDAVHLIANEGWRLMTDYEFVPETALWRHRTATQKPPRSLADLSYVAGDGSRQRALPLGELFNEYMGTARQLLSDVAPETNDGPSSLATTAEALRWFPVPAEVATSLRI